MRGRGRETPLTVLPLPEAAAALAGEEPYPDPYPAVRFERAGRTAELGRALRRTQLLAAVFALLALLAVGGLVGLAGRGEIRPYLVGVDAHGEAVALGPAEELSHPDRRLIVHALGRWLRATRTVSSDRALMRELLEEGYALTGGRAVVLLNEHFRAHPPFARAERETVTLEVESVLSLSDDLHWRLQWSETVTHPGGARIRREAWQGLATVEITPPRTVEEVRRNPLGIRVVDFDLTRLPD